MTIARPSLSEIASRYLGIATLETRGSDALDFHSVSAGAVHKALEAAHQSGRQLLDTELHSHLADTALLAGLRLVADQLNAATEHARTSCDAILQGQLDRGIGIIRSGLEHQLPAIARYLTALLDLHRQRPSA